MSTTAQDQTTVEDTTKEDAAPAVGSSPTSSVQDPQTTPTPAPTTTPASPASKSSREYVLFEEARAETWTRIGAAEADTPDAALETLGEVKLKSGQRFMAIPSRFVRPVKPNITTVTTISFD